MYHKFWMKSLKLLGYIRITYITHFVFFWKLLASTIATTAAREKATNIFQIFFSPLLFKFSCFFTALFFSLLFQITISILVMIIIVSRFITVIVFVTIRVVIIVFASMLFIFPVSVICSMPIHLLTVVLIYRRRRITTSIVLISFPIVVKTEYDKVNQYVSFVSFNALSPFHLLFVFF